MSFPKISGWCLALVASPLLSAAPLRVMVVSDSDSFRDEYSQALRQKGAQVVDAAVPEAAALGQVDAVLLHRQEFNALPNHSQAALAEFARKGGGVVSVHGGVAAGTAAWGKEVLGGGWDENRSQRFNNLMMLYVLTDAHPVVAGASQFDLQDDTVYDLEMSKEVEVLASAFTPKGRDGNVIPPKAGKGLQASIYDIQPQIWTYEADHRAMVILQGSTPESFSHASIRSFVLRGLAWTAKRENIDELCGDQDLTALRYPAGGPLRAEDAVRQFELQSGFKATSIAAEPLINKPIAIQWDAKGRLWVAETLEYPNGRRPLVAESWKETGAREPGRHDRPARDRISILEDTDGDGIMDSKTVFHEGLELITGFCMHEDGVIVVSQPNIVWLRDTDGDDKADQEVPLFAGFTPFDTHFVANHFIAAPDGWIYVSNGSGDLIRDPKTEKEIVKLSPGVFRFKADGSAIEQVASQGGNTFGTEVTSDMEIYHSKATSGDPIQHVVLPEWVLNKAPTNRAQSLFSVNPGRTIFRKDLPDRAPLMQIDQVGRFTAACSVMYYEGGAWPESYDGTMFTTEPILDVVHHEKIVPAGASYKGELVLQDQEWLRSKDFWFCPIEVALGPDGAAYILDFYTPVVAHNDTRGPQHSKSNASVRPDREHYFGRIYRIQHGEAPALKHPDLTQANAEQLVAAFRHPNRVVRFNALRVLMEKSGTLGEAASPLLIRMATRETFEPARIQALWALQRLGKLPAKALNSIAISSEGHIRKNALLIAEAGAVPLEEKAVDAALGDEDERVRLAGLRALGASAMNEKAGRALLAAVPDFKDDWSLAAAAAAASANPSPFLIALIGKAENSAEEQEFARLLAASITTNRDDASVLKVLPAIAKAQHAGLAVGVLRELAKNPPPLAEERATAGIAVVKPLLLATDRTVAASALPIAIAWDSRYGILGREIGAVAKELLAVARDPGKPENERIEAIRSLLPARAANDEILPNVLDLVSQPPSEGFFNEVVAALSLTGEKSVGDAFWEKFLSATGKSREQMYLALMTRPEWASLVLDGLKQQKIDPKTLPPEWISRLTRHPDRKTAKAASDWFDELNRGSETKQQTIARLLPLVSVHGNLRNGKEKFMQTCSVCHIMEDKGSKFGPDLDGIGSHPVNELLTHIIDPSLVVDDEHRTWNITLKNGTQYSALIASENDTRVQLRMPGGVTLDIKPEEIASRAKGGNSLMPEGFEALGAETLRDIIIYMQSVVPNAAK